VGKVNVYLPDDLEAALRASGLSISAICQQAVADVVSTAEALGRRDDERDLESILAGATRITPRLRTILGGLAEDGGGDGPITAHDLFAAIARHGDNVGVKILRMAGVELPAPAPPPREPARAPARTAVGRRALSPEAATTLSSALRVAIEMRHNYIGAEHVVIALATAPSPLTEMFAALGVDAAQLRRHAEHVVGAVPGVAPAPADTVTRLDRLERELAALRDEVASLGGRGRRRTR
jgi:hypothetical protein